MYTVIIADDHPVTLEGMKVYIEKMGHMVLRTCQDGIEAYNQISALKPNIAILDLSMPGMNGLEVLEKIRAHNKSTKIIIYTMYTETTLFDKAVRLGVNGYVLKEFAMEELALCIESLTRSKEWFSPKLQETLVFKQSDNIHEQMLILTPAERKILSLVAQEKSSKQIAENLFISEKTVENHRTNIIKKLQLKNTKNSLLAWAITHKGSL
jgi:DNA-binding NarL/FixJ family response regulator